MRHRDLRTALAVEVVAAAMPNYSYPLTDDEVLATYTELSDVNTRRGAILNCALHALITHDEYHPTNTLVARPSANTWRELIDHAIRVGESCKGTWDGCEYAWQYHAERITRFLESVCTYRVPCPA